MYTQQRQAHLRTSFGPAGGDGYKISHDGWSAAGHAVCKCILNVQHLRHPNILTPGSIPYTSIPLCPWKSTLPEYACVIPHTLYYKEVSDGARPNNVSVLPEIGSMNCESTGASVQRENIPRHGISSSDVTLDMLHTLQSTW